MTEEDIRSLIEQAMKAGTELTEVEFKDARGGFPSDPVAQTMSAFGNTTGGLIVFGVSELADRSLEIVGTESAADLQEKTTQISLTRMSHVLRLEYHVLDFEDKTIVAVYVPECAGYTKPYYIKKYGMHRGAYVREGIIDRLMTEEEVRSYVRNAQVDDFDETCFPELSMDDLSMEKIEDILSNSALKTGRSAPQEVDVNVLKNIGILGEQDGHYFPTLAGYLIFAKDDPQNILAFERYKIRCVRYKGTSVASDILDKADILGTLDEQIDAMESFVLRNIRTSAEIVGTKRVERYEYPKEAIREIIANAVIHRDYRIKETYVQVNIFEDRIEVSSPGNLPPGVTVENIKDAQESRNRIIAARLHEMEYLEEYGRGIDITFALMDEWDLLPPIFKNSTNSFKVILPGEKLSGLNNRQIKIWNYFTEHAMATSRDISEKVLVGVPSPTVNYDLRKMIELGLIQKEGDARNTYYKACF